MKGVKSAALMDQSELPSEAITTPEPCLKAGLKCKLDHREQQRRAVRDAYANADDFYRRRLLFCCCGPFTLRSEQASAVETQRA